MFSHGMLWLRSTGMREAFGPVNDSSRWGSAQREKRTPGRNPCSCLGAQRILVRSVPVTQGKGDWQPKDCLGDREGALSWGGTGMWGMRVCVQWAWEIPGRASSCWMCMCCLPCNLSLSLDSLPWGGARSQLGGDLLLSWWTVWSKAGRFVEGLHLVGERYSR